MSTRITLAASLFLPAALLMSTGCKSKSSTPEQASQPQAQSATAPSNSAAPSAAAAPPSSSSATPGSTATSATSAQPAPAASPTGTQPAAASRANVATNAPPPPPPPPSVVVPAGTRLRVRLTQQLGSKLSEDGQRFDAALSSPVVVKGARVIPAGTSVVGTVVEAHPSGRFKGGASLVVELNSIRLNGRTYPIRTTQYSAESKGKGKRTAGFIGGGGAGGALIGGIAGGGKGALIGGLIGAGAGTAGAATGNRDITLGSESLLSFQLASSLTLPPRKAAASPEPER